MGFGRQIVVLGSVVWVGGMLLQAEAMAFGHQWRPATGYGPGPQAGIQQLPNLPGFRPHAPVRSALARDRVSQRQPSVYGRSYFRAYPQPFPVARFHPAVAAVSPRLHPGMQPGYAAGAYPVPGWLPPPLPALGPWGRPMPLFTRQFAWQPAGQPWIARPPAAPWQRQYIGHAPRTAGYLPRRPAHLQGGGRWRPDQRAMMPNQRFVGGVPGHVGANRQPVRPFGSPAYTPPGMRAAHVAAQAGAVPIYWRPQVGGRPVAVESNSSFRPRAYGRRTPMDRRVAARSGTGGSTDRERLPGWLTTHEDQGGAGTCSWCGGS